MTVNELIEELRKYDGDMLVGSRLTFKEYCVPTLETDTLFLCPYNHGIYSFESEGIPEKMVDILKLG